MKATLNNIKESGMQTISKAAALNRMGIIKPHYQGILNKLTQYVKTLPKPEQAIYWKTLYKNMDNELNLYGLELK